MIISKVFGGLGNQMFQYVAGRALSARLGTGLQVDVRSHGKEGASHNGYELARVFCIDPAEATDESVNRMLGWRSHRNVQRVLRKVKLAGGNYVAEPHFHHWPGFDELTDGCYLDGYWQSYRYFETVESLVRNDLRFRLPLEHENMRVAQLIDAEPASASIHVRRGDYVSNKSASSHHGTCDMAYYGAALEHLGRAARSSLRVFVFSDDIDWVKANLPLPSNAVYVGHNHGRDSHFDMQLMSRCRHNILANSSFSWWAAWLNQFDDQVVVAPKRWFLADYDTTTLTPSSWIRL